MVLYGDENICVPWLIAEQSAADETTTINTL